MHIPWVVQRRLTDRRAERDSPRRGSAPSAVENVPRFHDGLSMKHGACGNQSQEKDKKFCVHVFSLLTGFSFQVKELSPLLRDLLIACSVHHSSRGDPCFLCPAPVPPSRAERRNRHTANSINRCHFSVLRLRRNRIQY